jgi:hypothetical protein
MEDKKRPVVITDLDGKTIAEFDSIKAASNALFGGTQSGTNTIQSLCTGRVKKSYCDKLKMKIKAKYKY